MKFHLYSEQYPPMSEAELVALAQDIAEHGQLHAVLTYRGEIVDGRNRWTAMRRILGKAPEDVWTEEFEGTEATLIGHLDALNLRRRQLSAAQRACLAVLRMEIVRKIRKTCPAVDKLTREDAAKEFGVSTGYIADAGAVRNAFSEVFHQVFLGQRELPEAYRWVLGQKRGKRDIKPENGVTDVTGTGSDPDQELDAEEDSAVDAGDPVKASTKEDLTVEIEPAAPVRHGVVRRAFRCEAEQPAIVVRVELELEPGTATQDFGIEDLRAVACPACGGAVHPARHFEVSP